MNKENDAFKEMQEHPKRFPFLCARDKIDKNIIIGECTQEETKRIIEFMTVGNPIIPNSKNGKYTCMKAIEGEFHD